MNGIQSLASAALNLFREFVPGNPDAARFWLEMGVGSFSLLVVLGLLLRFFGSANARPGLILLSGILGVVLLAGGPAAVEIYALPSVPAPAISGVESVCQWAASRWQQPLLSARTVLLAVGLIGSLFLLVVPLTRWTFRVPGFLALLAWLAALATAGTVSAVIRTKLPSAPSSAVQAGPKT
ncbi:MAG: hypothetical protein NTZ01_07105 [Verrucomicrobia bacterium]|nr:hypothetical protein [Verrucomicrobiota bacterium]